MSYKSRNPEPESEIYLRGLFVGVLKFLIGCFVILLALVAIRAIYLFVSNAPIMSSTETALQVFNNELIIYITSWIILLILSILATLQIREIVNASSNRYRRRANFIAIMIGLVLAIFLFKQPYLEQLFSGYTTGGLIKAILFTSGMGSGWLVWYLKHLKKYGEFFNVFLHTMIIGFCWYARLTAPEQLQLTAVAFLLGSLFHIAKDYLDKADLEAH